jgi:hypothetical protein
MIDNQKNDRKSAPAPPSRFAASANAENREGERGVVVLSELVFSHRSTDARSVVASRFTI